MKRSYSAEEVRKQRNIWLIFTFALAAICFYIGKTSFSNDVQLEGRISDLSAKIKEQEAVINTQTYEIEEYRKIKGLINLGIDKITKKKSE